MNVSRRTQAERTKRTRAALIAAATRLFGEAGYAAVSTTAVAREAGVTRGALYHHFADKRELFRAVYEGVEAELTQRAAATLPDGEEPPPSVLDALVAGAELFLDACLEPATKRIVLEDAPAVLGWREWREVGERYGLGVIEGALGYAIELGEVAAIPLRPTAHALLGALDELALWVAEADDSAAARSEAGRSLRAIAAGLRA